jgi:hypothetical protein
VAEGRAEHAKLLQAEVDRARPSGPSSSASAPPSTSAAPPPSGGTPDQVVEALKAAQQAAAALLATVPTYRAGLLGSVAAGCASLVEVLS